MTEHATTNRRQFTQRLASLSLALLLGLTGLNATSEAQSSSSAATATVTVRNRCGERCYIAVGGEGKWVNNGASQTFRATSTSYPSGSTSIWALSQPSFLQATKYVPVRNATYTVKTNRYGLLIE